MSAEQSRLRTTLLGSLLDVARRNRARGAGAVRLFEAGRGVPAPRPARGLPPSPTTSPRCCSARCARPAGASPSRGRPTSSPPRARWRRARRAARRLDGGGGASRAVPAPGARGAHPHRRRAGRLAGRAASRRWPPTGTWQDTVAGFELDLDAVPEPAHAAVRRRHELSRDPRGPRRRRGRHRHRRPGARASCAARARRCWPAPRCSTSTATPQRIGEGNVSLALALRFRAADRTLTDERGGDPRGEDRSALADELEGRIRS